MTIDGGKDLQQRDEIALGEVVLEGLGVAFLQHWGADAKAELRYFVTQVADKPRSFSIRERDLRRANLRRFP
jgi:hypothetical protein